MIVLKITTYLPIEKQFTSLRSSRDVNQKRTFISSTEANFLHRAEEMLNARKSSWKLEEVLQENGEIIGYVLSCPTKNIQLLP